MNRSPRNAESKWLPANKKRDLRGKKKAGDESRGGNSSRVPKSKRREQSVGEEENGKGAAGDAEGICEMLQLEILSPVMRYGGKKVEKTSRITKGESFCCFFFISSTLYRRLFIASVCFPSRCSELFLDEIRLKVA